MPPDFRESFAWYETQLRGLHIHSVSFFHVERTNCFRPSKSGRVFIQEFLGQFVVDLFSVKYGGILHGVFLFPLDENHLQSFLASFSSSRSSRQLTFFLSSSPRRLLLRPRLLPLAASPFIFTQGLPRSAYRRSPRHRLVSVCTRTRCSRTERLLILAPFPRGDCNLRSRYATPRAPTRRHLPTHHSRECT